MKRSTFWLRRVSILMVGVVAAGCSQAAPEDTSTPTITPVQQISVAPGGPFEGVSGPGYPTDPLDMDTGAVSLLLDSLGQVRVREDKTEVKDRQYEATGSFPVTVNGVVFNATEIKVLSELKLEVGTGDHEGTIDVDIDTIPGGHITLEYQGTATMTGASIVSAGTFETTKTTGTFDGLVAEGTYAMTIVESGDTLGAGVAVTISTRSAATAPPAVGAGGQRTVSVADAQLSLESMGEVKEAGGQITEIKDRKYQASGVFPVIINGSAQIASEISIDSSISKIENGAGDHCGKIVIRVIGGGHLDLAYEGRAQISGNTIKSNGTFVMTKTGDSFMGLASAEGTYDITIVESETTLGAPVTVSISIPSQGIRLALDGTVGSGGNAGVTTAGGDASAGWNMVVTKAEFDGARLRVGRPGCGA